MTVSISNSGAQEGVLEDLVLLVRTKRQDVNWFLVPGALVDEEKFLKPPPNPAANWMKGFFHPLKLDGKHAEVLTVFFVVDPQHLLNRPLAEIPEGGLTITILSRELGSHDWKEQHRIFSGFNQKSLENIRSGQDTYITTAEQSDEERKNIH